MSEVKKLYRDNKNGKFLGVCAGLAEYLKADVVAVRLLVLAIIIFSGIVPGIIFYLIAAVMMPDKEQ